MAAEFCLISRRYRNQEDKENEGEGMRELNMYGRKMGRMNLMPPKFWMKMEEEEEERKEKVKEVWKMVKEGNKKKEEEEVWKMEEEEEKKKKEEVRKKMEELNKWEDEVTNMLEERMKKKEEARNMIEEEERQCVEMNNQRQVPVEWTIKEGDTCDVPHLLPSPPTDYNGDESIRREGMLAVGVLEFHPPSWYIPEKRWPGKLCLFHDSYCNQVERDLLLLHPLPPREEKERKKKKEKEKEERRVKMQEFIQELKIEMEMEWSRKKLKQKKMGRKWRMKQKKKKEDEERKMEEEEEKRQLQLEEWMTTIEQRQFDFKWTIYKGNKIDIPQLLSSPSRDYLIRNNGEKVNYINLLLAIDFKLGQNN